MTDAQLPGEETGMDLCRRLSRERPDVQLVVTTATGQSVPSEVPRGTRNLHKPYASGELRTLVAAGSPLESA